MGLSIACILKRARIRPMPPEGLSQKADKRQTNRNHNPLETGSGSVHRYPISRWSIIPGYAQTAGSGQYRLKFVLRDQQNENVYDLGILLSERHCRLCHRTGRRKSTDYGAVIRNQSAAAETVTTKPEYKAKLSCAFCFSRENARTEYYHNSSWLEHGGAPDKAVRSAFVSAIDGYLKQIR